MLDLDGSNFPLKQSALERAAIVAEVAKDTAGVYAVEKTQLRGHFSMVSPAVLRESMSIRLASALTVPLLNSLRTHGYRIALPRSSPSDPFPSR